MTNIAAQDVKRLRDATGAGFMDSKKALSLTGGDFDAATAWLREKGLTSSTQRQSREASEGAVAMARSGNAAALVELRSETDFVAKSPDFVDLANELAQLVLDEGEEAVSQRTEALDNLKITMRENVGLGRVVRFEASGDNVVDAYLHVQNDRGTNGVLIELAGGTRELAHDIAVHIAFTRPQHLSRDDVPNAEVEAERQLIEARARNEGKPENALPKIVEGRLTGWFKERCLLQQGFVKEEKQTIQQLLGDASIVRFAQVVIGK